MKGVILIKLSCPPQVNESNNFTGKNKGYASKPKIYRGKKTQTKTQGPELEAETHFKRRCSDLEDYIFDIGLRASEFFPGQCKSCRGILGRPTPIAAIQIS